MRGSTRAFSVGATGTRRIVQRRSYIECKCGALYSQILRFSISSLVDTTLPQPTIQLDSCPFGRSFFCSLYTPSQLFVVYSGFNDPLTPRYPSRICLYHPNIKIHNIRLGRTRVHSRYNQANPLASPLVNLQARSSASNSRKYRRQTPAESEPLSWLSHQEGLTLYHLCC